MTSFTYLHARPETSTVAGIFYVGKGNRKRRAYDMDRRNKYHSAVIAKYGAKNILVSTIECSSEQIAFELEQGLIKCLLRSGVKLCNMTLGGEGAAGIPTSEVQKQHMKEFNLRYSTAQRKYARSKEPADTNHRRSETMKQRHLEMSEDAKAAASEKMSAKNYASWSDPAIRERRIQGMLGKKKTMTEAALAQRKSAANSNKERN